jgi:hypothetical protein
MSMFRVELSSAVKVTVHVLPTVLDVHRRLYPSGRLLKGRKLIPAFFSGNKTNPGGHLWFGLDECSPGLVAHEANHAALHEERYWLRYLGGRYNALMVCPRTEENVCRRMQSLTDRIWPRIERMQKEARP